MKTQSNFLNLKFILPSTYIMTYQISISTMPGTELIQYIRGISKFLQYVSSKWKNEIEKMAQKFMPCILYKSNSLS
jgi:hypothetical protein